MLSKTKPSDILENAPYGTTAFEEYLMLKHLQNLLYKLYKTYCPYCSVKRDCITFLTLNLYMLSVQHSTVQLGNSNCQLLTSVDPSAQSLSA